MEKTKKLTPLRVTVTVAVALVAAILLTVIGYVIYVLVDYYRIEDDLELDILNGSETAVPSGRELKIMTYNIGFGAYTPEFSFFMDGGESSRAFSRESVEMAIEGVCELLERENADIIMLEEVDERATRSHGFNQRAFFENRFLEYDCLFAVNYDSPYLFYPFNSPHGSSLAGMLTMSRFNIAGSVRKSLPVETSLMKLVDLDRCYSVSRLPVDNGKELVLYTVHLSAYTSDGTIATEQLKLLIDDMRAEYEKGNYAVCGGDFNKDLLGDSSKYFGVSGEEYTWAQPIPSELLADSGLTVVAPSNAPSCRNADAPYHEGQFVLTVDGFIVSDNVSVGEYRTVDTDFAYSDHDPVVMTITLDS